MLTSDGRLWGRGSDFAEVKADPKNENIVYSANVVMWKSLDGGKNWEGIKGAPGGDDYHRIWINPNNTNIIAIGLDQGGTITVNGGETYSSWYNQPTAQFYHVSTDNAFLIMYMVDNKKVVPLELHRAPMMVILVLENGIRWALKNMDILPLILWIQILFMVEKSPSIIS